MGIKSNNPSESYFNFFGQSGKDAVGAEPPGGFDASGGTTTESGGYKYHAFTDPNSDNFVVSSVGSSPGAVEYLVVAGGGSGGHSANGNPRNGGGGGVAGGLRHNFPSIPGN